MLCRRASLLLLACWAFGGPPLSPGADTDADRTALAVDTLTRLPQTDLSSNPKLKEAVLRVLEKTRGTPNFVRLVQHFQLPDQDRGLLEIVLVQPPGESGVQAIRLLLAGGRTELLRQTLAGTNRVAAVRVVEALGNTGDQRVNALLLPLLSDAGKDGSVRREAVRALARTADGARELLRLAREDALASDLRFAAGAALSQVRWPEIKSQAVTVLPPAQAQNSQPLPPLAELLSMKGDARNGARVFTNASPGCIQCHVVHGRGTELGPDLSEIGTKLGKDALYEAILEPSAGISFGYEAFSVALKDGDEVYGMVASETTEEIVMKAVGGIITRIKKEGVASRQASKLSIMPAGLTAAMTPQELVDLVEYLASLRKP